MTTSTPICRPPPLTFHLSRFTLWCFVLLMLLPIMTGCSNIIRSGLMNSNTVFLDPSMNRTAYLQLRNTSENQTVMLNEVQSKLTTKGYQLTKDPEQANYWIQAKVIYCHKAAEGVAPASAAAARYGLCQFAAAASTRDNTQGRA